MNSQNSMYRTAVRHRGDSIGRLRRGLRSRSWRRHAPALDAATNLELRRTHLAPSLKAHYEDTEAGPLKVSHGIGAYLYDTNGREYVDCVNNVCHVGHCHPRVIAAATQQLATLNTNTRYLHDNIVRLATEIVATMPDPLSVAFFTNSGTEANDLALRLARNKTARRTAYCVDGAYHGHSAATLAVSPYGKYSALEADSQQSVKLMMPDRYRLGLPEPAVTALALAEYRGHLARAGAPPAAYIVESVMCCGGQIFLPEGYLAGMQRLTREHGGISITDEVQTGFGRTGSRFWAFENHEGAAPDIVTLGKPFGNGFPLSAVVCTPEVAAASHDLEYFNTFGGSPVACAIGLEVIDVIRDEQLQANAAAVGAYALERLAGLLGEFESVGEVRGQGLLIGVELVSDSGTRAPDAEAAAWVMQRMKALGVLVSSDGPHRNVLKIKPPLVFSKKDADRLHSAMHTALREHQRKAAVDALPAGGITAWPHTLRKKKKIASPANFSTRPGELQTSGTTLHI
eukprot:g5793.t1